MAGNLTTIIASIFSGGVTADPYFEYTTLLLPGNGTNGAQNNTFLDGSTNNFTITRNGNTTQGTFSPFSQTGWGNYFEGVGFNDNITVPSSATLGFGTGDFTIECWVYNTAYTGTNNIFVDFRSASADVQPCIYVTNAGVVAYFTNNANRITSSSSVLNLNQWYHVALARSGTTTKLFVNGNQVGSDYTDTNNYGTPGSNRPMFAGNGTGAGDSYFAGYISNLRVTKGRAVYTGAFTPPTTPLTRTTGGTNPPQGTECSLLICQSNRFLDSNGVNVPASSPLTITVNGTVSVVAFSPFNPTASWSAATYGGSGYFDGSGDYLVVGSAADWAFLSNTTALWSIEMWVYHNNTSTSAIYFDTASGGSANVGITISRGSSNLVAVNIYRGVSGSPVINASSTTQIIPNAWNHVLITYDQSLASQNAKIYINGGSAETGNKTANTPSSSNPNRALTIGTFGAGLGEYFFGNIGSLRISNVIRSSGVPTTPYTSDANTKLLLNFTNAGIYDATSKNDLETVGNAQISTAISAKWGSGTIALDGNGDYLNIPSSQLNVFGTGDFTIEMWAYITDYTTGSPTFNDYGPFFDFRTANTSQVNVVLSFLSTFGGTGRPCMFINGAVTITGNVMTTNSWTHIALSRVSGVTRMYMGGDQAGANYTDTNNYTSTVCTIGVNIARDAFLKGYIQDPRITRGYGRYVTGTGGNAGKMVLNGTNTLALPTAAFPTL